MKTMDSGCRQLVLTCADLKSGEKALVISDDTTYAVGELVADAARQVTGNVVHRMIKPFSMHGQEPTGEIAAEMLKSDVIFGITHMSMAHTQARFAATNRGARYLSLPDYSVDLLSNPALTADFRGIGALAKKLTDRLDQSKEIVLTTGQGSELSCRIEGRKANAAPGWCEKAGMIASPPDAEVNIALKENESQGEFVVNGSIPYDGIGLLTSPIKVTVSQGKVQALEGQGEQVKRLKKLLWEGVESEKKRTLAEFGIGLNPKALLCGIMLIDEGALGTIHIGLGSNATIGGLNKVNFHLDLVIDKPDLKIDGVSMMRKGTLS